MKKTVLFAFLGFVIMFASCGKSTKESAGNLNAPVVSDAETFAKQKFGESVKIVYKGDLTGNKQEDALVLVVNKDFGSNKYWIQKGSVIEKTPTDWKTLLAMEEELKTPKGPMIEQQKAVNGYIVRFVTGQTPMNIFISIADANGRPSSDEATLRLNSKDSKKEFIAGSEESTP